MILCSERYFVVVSGVPVLRQSVELKIVCRRTGQIQGSIIIGYSQPGVHTITMTPFCEELMLVISQFLFLDKSISKLQLQNLPAGLKRLTKDTLKRREWDDSPDAIHIVCCLLINPAAQVLVGQRAANAFYGGTWEFPGGKIEPGETAPGALIRELQEELEITVAANNLTYIKSYPYHYINKTIKLHIFKTATWEGAIKKIVHDNLQWVEYSALNQLLLPPADLALLIDFPTLL